MNAADQYRIIAEGAGWVGRPDRGRLRFDGRDAKAFLQALLTNDVSALEPGQAVYAAYLTPQGRMISDLRLYQASDHLLAQVPAGQAGPLAARFDHLVFSEDVRVADVSADVDQITVVGAAAAEAVASASVIVARNDDVELPAFDIFFPHAARSDVVSHLDNAGVREVPFELFDALRIEAGRPAYGVDMTEETIPLEAGLLERGISTTKGCYVGQEIIIRVLHRGGGRVARRLVKLRFGPEVVTPPPVGAALTHEGQDVGRITSAARSPATGRIVALGYVHRDRAEPGTVVAAGEAPAGIVGFAG